MNVLAGIVYFSVFAFVKGYNTLWPLPQKYLVEPAGAATPLSTGFSIEANYPSQALDKAIQRYLSIILKRARDVDRKFALPCTNATTTIDKLYIDVVSQDESLTIDTVYNYTLTVDHGSANITASTIYGAM